MTNHTTYASTWWRHRLGLRCAFIVRQLLRQSTCAVLAGFLFLCLVTIGYKTTETQENILLAPQHVLLKKVYMVGLLESLRQPLSDAGSGFFKSMSSRSSSESMRSTSSSIMSLAESAHTAAVASLMALLSTATFEGAPAIANDYRYPMIIDTQTYYFWFK